MRIVFYIIFTVLSLSSYSQIGAKGKTVYLDTDTIKGLDTVYVTLPELTGFYSLAIELYFEEIGGTSDGVGYLQASNDSIYSYLNSYDGLIVASPNDSIVILDKGTQLYWLLGTPSNKYRVQLIGTTGDTTKVISNYIRK